MGYTYPISWHGITISHVEGIKKRAWIIYRTTYPIPCLVEHRIG